MPTGFLFTNYLYRCPILIQNFCNLFSLRYFSVIYAGHCIKIRFGEKKSTIISGLFRYMDAHGVRLGLVCTAIIFHSSTYDFARPRTEIEPLFLPVS